MKKILLSFLILSVSLFATVTNQVASQKLINSNIPIVDIRTPAEWKETGLLKRAIPIMFFDEKGKYDIDMFLKKLNKAVDTTKPFAIICRSGNRSRIVSDFLSKNFNYNVINLEKGMIYAKSLGLPIVPYK